MAKISSIMKTQIASHPWQSLSANTHLGCEDYIRKILLRFSPNDQKEIQWMLDQNVLSKAFLKYLSDLIVLQSETKTKTLESRMKNILHQYNIPEDKVYSAGEKECYFRFRIIQKGDKFLAFVQGEEKYGEQVIHGEGETEFEALKSLVEELKTLAPQIAN